ncbi:MAG TPA: trigger factor [Thermoanaerobaculia bacterium]|nr:trigger factor [Thermoanaerobaculia bacterium]
MSVVVSQQDVGPCRKQLTVEVPAPAVEAEEQRVLKDYGNRARIPGFRAGKVPAKLIRQRFGQEIDREVVERLLPRYWKQAQAEASLDPLLPPEIEEVKDREPGGPLTFVAVVETRPQIELRNIRDFDLPNPSIEPGEMEIDDRVEDLRRRIASWVPAERAAARGDLVTAELTRLTGAHGEAEAGEAKTDTVDIELGDERVWEELTLALSGLAAGQEATFTRRHEHPPAEEGGQPSVHEEKFRARVQAVKERDLPPLDDAFAAKVSPDFTALPELREAISRSLRHNKQEQRREERERALLEQLRERHPLELPQGVVRREVENMVKDQAQSLAQRGIDVEHLQIDWNQMAGEMLPLAERRVHARLLLDAIADADSVQVSEEEFERALAVLARAQNTSTPQLRRALDEDGRLVSLRSQLRREKTIRHLLGEEPAEPGATVQESA